MHDPQPTAVPTPAPFPRAFWAANVVELFERGAYYSMASFVVLYLGQLGLGDYWPSTLNGILWSLVYFLPILSGTIADQVGFRRSLLVAFVLLVGGYLCLGAPVWWNGATLAQAPGSDLTAGLGVVLPVALGILLIGMGGSVVKPCISGTVQKTHLGRATLAFAIFYMVINIGSLTGRGASFLVRTSSSLVNIFAVAAVSAALAFLLVALLYRDPDRGVTSAPRERKPLGRILLDMVLVLKDLRFALFLAATTGFWFLYSQVYNVLPLYLKKVVETDPAVDLVTMANPLTIVFFQLVITKLFGKVQPLRSILVGIVLISLSMIVNVLPLFAEGGVRAVVAGGLPLGTLLIVLTVTLIAFGELFTAARMYEYIGALAPKGREGLFLGYASLPTAIGSLLGGPVGAYLFHGVMCRGASKRPDGLLELDPSWGALGWGLLMAIGLLTGLGMLAYDRWLKRQGAATA
jgi:dipeptide/tripeptide permease